MKKLLAIVLVLGLASFAGAALKITAPATVNGLVTTISFGDNNVGNPAESYFALVCSAGQATISGGAIVPTGVDFSIFDGASAVIPVPAGNDGIWGGLYNTAGAMPKNTAYVSGINMVASQYGKVLVTLYSTDFGQVTELDSAYVNFVPEPITMTLMGIGGLVALRRRMA